MLVLVCYAVFLKCLLKEAFDASETPLAAAK